MKSIPAGPWPLHLLTSTSEPKGRDTLSEPCQEGWRHPEFYNGFPLPSKDIAGLQSSDTEIIPQHPCSWHSFPRLLPGGRNPKHEVWLYNMNTHSMIMVIKPQTPQRAVIYYRPRDRQQPSPWSLGTHGSSDPDWSCLSFSIIHLFLAPARASEDFCIWGR